MELIKKCLSWEVAPVVIKKIVFRKGKIASSKFTLKARLGVYLMSGKH